MKTTSITVERNFHCMNDDRFIMEKIGMTVELENDDSATTAISMARQTIENNFKLAYPKVEDSLNFHVVRDYGDPKIYSSNNGIVTVDKETASQLKDKATWQVPQSDEKINKGTIEEQIQSFEGTQEEFVKTWEYVSNMNPKYKEVYKKRFAQLHPLSLYKNINQ